MDETGETRHDNSPPTKNVRVRLGWGRGGVWVEVGLGWVGIVQLHLYLPFTLICLAASYSDYTRSLTRLIVPCVRGVYFPKKFIFVRTLFSIFLFLKNKSFKIFRFLKKKSVFTYILGYICRETQKVCRKHNMRSIERLIRG